MILKVTIPAIDATFRSGFIARWHKHEGDPINFGDDICDVVIDEFLSIERTLQAVRLGSTSKMRRHRIKDSYSLKRGYHQATIRLTSAESGMRLAMAVVPEGGQIEIGSLVAVLSDLDGDEPGDIDAAPDARIAVNMPDAEDLDPFE